MGNEIFPKNADFLFENNKKDIHIAPVYIDNNISYRISYRCLECGRENIVFMKHDYSFVPRFSEILSRVKTPCLCKKYIFTQSFHGITYHLNTDTTMRYTLAYKSNRLSRIYLSYKGQLARVYDPKSDIKPKALEIINSCAAIKNSLPQWINSFKALDNILLLPESDMPQKPMPEINAKTGDVYYLKIKSICDHHFYRVTGIKPSVVEVECTDCGHKKRVPKDVFVDYYKYAYHSNISNTTKVPQKEVKTSPAPLISKREISAVDVIVLSTSKRCTDLNHTIIDYIGVLPVMNNNQYKNLEINIGYCKQCDKYIMLISDYIKISGSPICEVRDQTTGRVYNKMHNIYGMNSAESVLHQYGYNVRAGNGLSSMDRQQILLKVMDNGVLSKNQIISHLEYCINMASGRLNMDSAIRKWSMDLDFVRCYNPKAKHVAINSITLKYSKKK